MNLAVNVAVGSPFPFLIPQLCNFLFTLIYCVYFVYKVIKFIKWWYGFWDFSFKELFFKLIKCFSWYCFVDGYSVVRIAVMVLVLFPKDSLIQSQREGREERVFWLNGIWCSKFELVWDLWFSLLAEKQCENMLTLASMDLDLNWLCNI